MNDQKPSKWGKAGTVALTILSIGLCVAGISYVRSDILEAAGKYEENLKLAKSQCAAFSREDALAMRQVPTIENAYPDIKDFINKIDGLHVDVDRTATSDDEFLAEWQPFEKFLPKLLASSKKQYLIVDSELNGPYYAMTPEPVMLTKWIHALCWLADIYTKKSDLKQSKELLVAAAKLTVMLRHEPDFKAITIRSESAMAIDRELSLLISSHGNDSNWQAMIENILTILENPYDFRPCYKYEHWITLREVQIRLGEIRDSSLEHETEGERFIPRYGKAAKSRVHELYGQMLNQYPADIEDFSGVYSLNKKLFEDGDYHQMSLKSFYYALSGHSSSIWEVQMEIAQRNAIKQAIAILKGNLDPAKGLPINGKCSFDSDGKPLRMGKLAKGWIIYSVGTDGKDNGGDESKRFNKDWVVHLPK